MDFDQVTVNGVNSNNKNAIITVNNVKMIEFYPSICYHRAKIGFINEK